MSFSRSLSVASWASSCCSLRPASCVPPAWRLSRLGPSEQWSCEMWPPETPTVAKRAMTTPLGEGSLPTDRSRRRLVRSRPSGGQSVRTLQAGPTPRLRPATPGHPLRRLPPWFSYRSFRLETPQPTLSGSHRLRSETVERPLQPVTRRLPLGTDGPGNVGERRRVCRQIHGRHVDVDFDALQA
jgi:hypothetical protein